MHKQLVSAALPAKLHTSQCLQIYCFVDQTNHPKVSGVHERSANSMNAAHLLDTARSWRSLQLGISNTRSRAQNTDAAKAPFRGPCPGSSLKQMSSLSMW
jgi:hypothetical protein